MELLDEFIDKTTWYYILPFWGFCNTQVVWFYLFSIEKFKTVITSFKACNRLLSTNSFKNSSFLGHPSLVIPQFFLAIKSQVK
jgi:hypothetical protein